METDHFKQCLRLRHLEEMEKHQLTVRGLANKSLKLAAESQQAAGQCWEIVAGICEGIEQVAGPYLELAEFNAELSQAAANDARRHAGDTAGRVQWFLELCWEALGQPSLSLN